VHDCCRTRCWQVLSGICTVAGCLARGNDAMEVVLIQEWLQRRSGHLLVLAAWRGWALLQLCGRCMQRVLVRWHSMKMVRLAADHHWGIISCPGYSLVAGWHEFRCMSRVPTCATALSRDQLLICCCFGPEAGRSVWTKAGQLASVGLHTLLRHHSQSCTA
jgi:hypothetical protein